jgi:hypothetical protein
VTTGPSLPPVINQLTREGVGAYLGTHSVNRTIAHLGYASPRVGEAAGGHEKDFEASEDQNAAFFEYVRKTKKAEDYFPPALNEY